MKKILSLFILLLITACSWGLEFNSGKEKVSLLELYTSQSCSSCPPAEKWLSELKNGEGLWKKYIPISYHVAYWNHLNWVDEFSKKKFSNRQRDYHRVIKGGVYTPQFVLNGSDYRNWRWRQDPTSIIDDSPGPLVANFDESNRKASLSFSPKKTYENLLCFGAYLESGHITKVLRGENRGKKIVQDFIVRHLQKARAQKNKKQFNCDITLNIDEAKTNIQKSLAFWIVDKETYKVIQATGGDLK